MVSLPVAKDYTHAAAATTTGNTRTIHAIDLCGVTVIDGSGYCDRRAGRRGTCRCRWGRCGRSPAGTTAIDVKHVVHGTKTAVHGQWIGIAAVWPGEVPRPGPGIGVRADDEEVVLNGLVRRQHFHHQLERPGWHGGR